MKRDMHNYILPAVMVCVCLLIEHASSKLITDFGAVANQNSYEIASKNSQALWATFQSANQDPSDRSVVVPEGDFYFTNSTLTNIHNVTFLFEGVALINNEIERWPIHNNDGGNFGTFYFTDCEDLTITSSKGGRVDGQGYDWWWYVILTGRDFRPHMFSMEHVKNLQIHDLYVQNSPQWHFRLFDLLGAHIRNVTVYVDVDGQKALLRKRNMLGRATADGATFFDIPTFPLNTDGIDPSGANVLIEDCHIENFDDAVAVKPITNDASKFGTQCSSNMLIRNSVVKYGVGMTIGSVPPNVHVNCVRDITFENITSHEPIKAIYVKTNPGNEGSGIIHNITYKNFQVHDSLWYPIWIGPQQQHQPDTKGTGCSFFYPVIDECPTNPRVPITDVTLSNIHMFEGVTLPGVLLCNSTKPCTGFVWDNVVDDGYFVVRKDYICKNVEGKATNSTPTPPCFQ